jgi:hypothetical protein
LRIGRRAAVAPVENAAGLEVVELTEDDGVGCGKAEPGKAGREH